MDRTKQQQLERNQPTPNAQHANAIGYDQREWFFIDANGERKTGYFLDEWVNSPNHEQLYTIHRIIEIMTNRPTETCLSSQGVIESVTVSCSSTGYIVGFGAKWHGSKLYPEQLTALGGLSIRWIEQIDPQRTEYTFWSVGLTGQHGAVGPYTA